MRTAKHRKKALVIISDGNDTSSSLEVGAVKAMIREYEVLVYAVGIDAQAHTDPWLPNRDTPFPLPVAFEQQQRPRPFPFPIPGGRRPGPARPPSPFPPIGAPPRSPAPPVDPRTNRPSRGIISDRVNIVALRDLTDDSGGRTEIIRSAYDLDPATAGIADELSKQYYLGYPATGNKDGRWHTIRVEVRGAYRVRARRGFMASSD
jgi:VWFA-related protein